MKKLLILAYDFPPYVSVGGLRPYSWYKYLKDSGIYPVVVTRQWSNKYGNHLDYIAPGDSDKTMVEETELGTIIRSPYKPNVANRIMLKYGEHRLRLLRKAISAWYEFAQWILPVGPKYGLYKSAREYLKTNSVDCIIATGDPFVLFRYASKLSQKHNIPWLADYRDPWIQDKSRDKNGFQKAFDSVFEKQLTKKAALLTTVSKHFEALICENINPQQFEIILNGYDSDVVSHLGMFHQNTDRLTISMAGTIYPFNPIQSVLENVSNFISSSGADINLELIGINNQNEVETFLKKSCLELAAKTTIHPRIDNKTVLEKLSKANVLLLFNYFSFPGTKIYDYLALRRKILFCFSDDPNANELKKRHYNLKEFPHLSNMLQADMITATNSGIIVRDAEHLKVVLQELWDEFQAKGYIECNSHGIEQYSRRHQTEKLAVLIKRVVEDWVEKVV